MRRSVLAAIVIVLGLAVSACGGDPKPASTGKTDTAASDLAKAQGLVLVAADFPAGWTGTQPTPDPEEDAQSKAFAACAGAVDPTVSESATFEGQDFDNEDASVSSDVTFVKTNEQAQTDLAAITGSKFESCAEDFAGDAFQGELEGSGATVESITFDPITTEKVGDATTAFRFSATVAAGGSKITVYVDLVFILKGRAEITVTFSDVGTPFEPALQRTLLLKMGEKLAKI